eukprot:TRINITY_DN7611_c0_g2_i2.p2 TRINITY_DN7611_c0_g2~~TRINITY_DN7611_c0_g2_i2.p2  ORF type:complete len:428 (-),score=116.78 TRINITY_DN7611_c0_g2_i2:726-1985(-)
MSRSTSSCSAIRLAGQHELSEALVVERADGRALVAVPFSCSAVGTPVALRSGARVRVSWVAESVLLDVDSELVAQKLPEGVDAEAVTVSIASIKEGISSSDAEPLGVRQPTSLEVMMAQQVKVNQEMLERLGRLESRGRSSADTEPIRDSRERSRRTLQNMFDMADGDSEHEDDEEVKGAGLLVEGRPAPSSRSAEATSGDVSGQVNQLVQLELLKFLQKQQDRVGDGDDSFLNTGDQTRLRGFKGVDKLRQRFKEQPQAIIDQYMQHVQDQLNVTSSKQYWSVKDYSKKLMPQFGRMRGLWRTHHMFAEALELMEANKHVHARAYVIQCLKALHQTALDNGDWRHAALIVPTPDPLHRPAFGGDEQELSWIHAYHKSMKELKGSHKKDQSDDSDAKDDDAGGQGDRGPKFPKKKGGQK